MKRLYSFILLAATTAMGVCAQTHNHHEHGTHSGLDPLLLKYTPSASLAGEGPAPKASFVEPKGMFNGGYTQNLSAIRMHDTRRDAAYINHTWTNTSTDAKSWLWTYDNPIGIPADPERLNSEDKDLSIVYAYAQDAYLSPSLKAIDGDQDNVYAPKTQYRFGGASVTVFSDAQLDMGMTPYMSMTYRDAKRYYTTTFGPLKYYPDEANDPYSSSKWEPILADKGYTNIKMQGFYGIFHKPNAPYSITKLWGWVEFTATEATTLRMTLYKINDEGVITDEVIAKGEMAVKQGSQKSVVFDLYGVDAKGARVEGPVAIDCAFAGLLDGFDNGKFTKVLPILGTGTVYEKGETCPWPHNCGAYLAYTEKGVEKHGYFIDPTAYEEGNGSSKLVEACDFLWMVDGCFPWMFDAAGGNAVEFDAAGGSKSITLNSFYQINDPLLKIEKDSWIDLTLTQAENRAGLNKVDVKVNASPVPRTGKVRIQGPAVDYSFTVAQATSGIEDPDADVSIIRGEYYDLTGRKLTTEPQEGLYIKVSYLGDGSKKIEKVVK